MIYPEARYRVRCTNPVFGGDEDTRYGKQPRLTLVEAREYLLLELEDSFRCGWDVDCKVRKRMLRAATTVAMPGDKVIIRRDDGQSLEHWFEEE